jgi:hypothetical protein
MPLEVPMADKCCCKKKTCKECFPMKKKAALVEAERVIRAVSVDDDGKFVEAALKYIEERLG